MIRSSRRAGRPSGHRAAGTLLCTAVLMAAASLAQAHGVREQREQREATVVTLSYGNGKPFAGEAWEVYATGAARPAASGRTDVRGRAAFVLDGPGPWRFRAYSKDGHGLLREFTLAATSVGESASAATQGGAAPVVPAAGSASVAAVATPVAAAGSAAMPTTASAGVPGTTSGTATASGVPDATGGTPTGPNAASRLLFGISLVLAAFGGLQLWRRRR